MKIIWIIGIIVICVVAYTVFNRLFKRGSRFGMSGKLYGGGRSDRGQGKLLHKMKLWIMGLGGLIVLAGAAIWDRADFIKKIFRIKKKTTIAKDEELVKQLKKPEDRDFWIEDEKKQQESTSHIISKTFFEQAEEAFGKKDFRLAETLYLEAARENPGDSKIFNRLGVIYLEYKKFDEAIEAFETALKYDDKIGSRHFNLALAYLGKGNFEHAKTSLMKATRLSPSNEKYQQVLEEIKKKC